MRNDISSKDRSLLSLFSKKKNKFQEYIRTKYRNGGH